ncbi:MAG TPA: serine/threonine-protein kinase [Polyangiaceae bacterium]|nr:serine/threonine-protein kinase [Polyangiaceae bacterium]
MSAKTATVYEPGYVVAGKYELEALLGQGGMGAVWRAKNIALDSPVAIKVVRSVGDGALLRGRLLQEARAAAKLRHPAIVKVFDVGQTETGDPFIVMELLHGDSLGKILERDGRLSAVQAVRTLLPICDALWLSHGKGIVHRDLKPDNVFIVQHEGAIQPTLVDFGIVKVQETEGESHLTKAGDVLGSPDYMSPEQARGLDDVNHLTDVWSFCVVLYEAIAGRTPFKGANYNALLRQIVEDTPPTLHQLSSGDAQLSAIVARGLSKQPDQRYQSMGELGRALAEWLIAQGVSEDICGTTLETKWLRSTDGSARVGRPTFASIADAWPSEKGSGVRRNLAEPVNTQPAPPRPEVEDLLASQPAPPPNRRPKWVILGGVVALVVVVLALAWGRGSTSPPSAESAKPAVPAAPAPLVPPAGTGAEAAPVAAEPAAPLPDSTESAAQPPPEPVSSKVGRAPGATRHGAKPAPVPSKKGAGSVGKAKAKPGDLLSPY